MRIAQEQIDIIIGLLTMLIIALFMFVNINVIMVFFLGIVSVIIYIKIEIFVEKHLLKAPRNSTMFLVEIILVIAIVVPVFQFFIYKLIDSWYIANIAYFSGVIYFIIIASYYKRQFFYFNNLSFISDNNIFKD